MNTDPRDTRPQKDEYPPYYHTYVSKVPAPTRLLATLVGGLDATLAIYRGIDDARAGHRYAEGKWSMKEVLGHIIDSERVFGYRALRFARGDATELPGFEQDDYVAIAGFDRRPLRSLIDEFEHVRKANVAFLASLGGEDLMRRGTANKGSFTTRAMFWIVAGHEIHHRGVLLERYL